jgi:pyruvate-formate lyase-activating enzyme
MSLKMKFNAVETVWEKYRDSLKINDIAFFEVVKDYSEELSEFLSQKTCGSFLSGFGLYEGRNNHDSFIITLEDAAHRLFFQNRIESAEKLLNHIYDLKYEDLIRDRTFKYVKRVNFEITSLCNLKCKYCTFESGKRKKYIDVELFEKILQDIADVHPHLQTLALYMSGESLLHPEFIELLEVVNKVKKNSMGFNPETYMHTNGTLWSPEMNDRIMETNVMNRVVWSIDGVDRESFKDMRGSVNNYEKVLNNFEYFLNNRPANVKAWVNNLREPQMLEKKMTAKLDKFLKLADVTTVFPPRDLNQGGLTRSPFIGESQKFCEYISHTVVITTNGQMSLCCADYNSENAFGDLKINSFYGVYYGKERMDIMKKMAEKRRKEINGCQNCSLLHPNWFHGVELSRTLEDDYMYKKKQQLVKKWKQLLATYSKGRVAVYGAGRHTQFLNGIVMRLEHTIIGAVIDDFPGPFFCLFGHRPKHPKDIQRRSFDAVILSTDCAQNKMAERCRQIFGQEMKLINLYGEDNEFK